MSAGVASPRERSVLEPPFFIVGCPRSGTTLLSDLLRNHPRLTIPGESHFIPAYFRGHGNPRSDAEAVTLASRILSLYRIKRWGVPIEPESFASDRSFAAVIHRLYGTLAQQRAKARWGDKTPHYVEAIPTLLAIFPDTRIIHIIRDGRDVSVSWVKAGIEPANLYTAAQLWKRMVRAGRAAGAALSRDTYLEVRYESLLQQPRAVMAGVCAFLGEPMCEDVLELTRDSDIVLSRLVGNRRLVIRGSDRIDPTNFDKWRTMPERDRALVESVAGDPLAELGYETEGLARKLSVLEELTWRLHHRVVWPIERLNTRNSHWMLADLLRTRWAAFRGSVR